MKTLFPLLFCLLIFWIQNCQFPFSDEDVNPDDTISIVDTASEVGDFPLMRIPEDNPQTEAGIRLGRHLFYDPALSKDSSVSCASCHSQKYAFADNMQFSKGVYDSLTNKNSSALVNPGWKTSYHWTGHIFSLEEQVNEMLTSPVIMDLTWSEAVKRIKNNDEYLPLFESAFNSDKIDSISISRAIAQFERALVSDNSKFDRRMQGEVEFTDEESRGFQHFFLESGDCFHCHSMPLFLDNDFRNNGLDTNVSGTGLELWTQNPADAGKWKTPTLRNIALTGPYMHDGRFETLEEVLEHYNSGGHYSPTVDPLIRINTGLGLSEKDQNDIIAFLKCLTDDSFINNPDLSDPW